MCGPDISERVLGHAIAGVEGVYDRHSYDEEKADALKRLAALVGSIVNPPRDNVGAIAEKKRGRQTDGAPGVFPRLIKRSARTLPLVSSLRVTEHSAVV